MSVDSPIIVRHLGTQDYTQVWQAMRDFTDQRDQQTQDEIWFVEHPAVFTLGQSGKTEHLLHPGDIPIVHTDRGGQVTYHGPGQLVMYVLLNLQRYGIGVRRLVTLLENSVIQLLTNYHLSAYARREAPGIYIDQAKIASIGLRIRKGCSYHGLALNVAMDLEPFSRINPCGYQGLRMTMLSEWGISTDTLTIARILHDQLLDQLSLTRLNRQRKLTKLLKY